MSGFPVPLADRSLASFPGAAELLALLRPEVAETLAGHLRPLVTMLGAVAAPRTNGREPAGIGDLATRGRYERLLVSEWLLASEVPDEFDRRAAMGEHLFLAPERRGPIVPVRTVVLFDAGPSQLGRPRIVQLAALVAFAVRARVARVPLSIGCLQEGKSLRDADVDALVALVGARSFDEATAADLERLGPFSAEDDLWLVGGAQLPAPRGSKRLVLADDEGFVNLAVMRPGQSVTRRTVPVPSTPGALLTLRDPRRRLAQMPATTGSPDDAPEQLGNIIHPSASVRFTSAGRHLLVRLEGGAIVAHRLRTSPRDPSQLRYRLRAPEGEVSLLGEQSRRGLALLTMAGDRIVLHALGKRGGRRGDASSYEAPPATIFRGSVEPCLLLPRLDATRAIFLDGDGRIWRLPQTGDPSVLAWDVQAIAESTTGFVMAQRSKGTGKGATETLSFTHVTSVPPFGALASNDGELGPGSWHAPVPAAAFIAWGGGDRALCRLPDGTYLIARDQGAVTPVGDGQGLLLHGFPAWLGATLVASDGDELLLMDLGGKRTPLARMTANIAHVCVAIDGRHLAVEDQIGHVTVFNASGERVLELLRARP